MSEAEALAEAARWFRFATEDLRSAEALLRADEAPPRNACYFAQQAVEKALKAVLAFSETDIPRTHDLDALRLLISDEWALKRRHPDLATLSEWAVEGRYPGDWPEATATEANVAVLQATAILEAVGADLEVRGLLL